MGKNDFDIDFDFEEEYGFDPKTFLGSEEYNDNVDLEAFSDEELGLTSRKQAKEEEEDFDLDEELDSDDFLNMGREEEAEEEDWEDPEDDSEIDVPEFMDKEFEDEVLEEDVFEETEEPEEADPEEAVMNEYEEEEVTEAAEEETFAFDDEDDEEEESKPRRKKERKPVQMPKITLPKITLPKLKTPNIFTKFYDLYFAPVLDKNWQNPEDPPQDPNSPKRRRRKTKQQIFKEVYLPPIIACVCLILVMSFLMGSLSNVIAQRRLDKEAEKSRLDESISAAEQQQLANQRILAQAEELAAGYDYQSAIDLLDSLGDLSQNEELLAKRSDFVTKRDSLVPYNDPTMIPNLSFHVLIHDMARALQDTDGYKGNYNRNFVSTSEFSKILENLYNNGYVLVDFNSFVGTSTDVNGNEQYQVIPMYLPADKKPVMITETMVNYFDYMIGEAGDGVANAKGDGFANKLVVDANGDIKAQYMDAAGQTSVGNYDLVPILEDFIEKHPDFSYRGARAILAVTGHEGVFGYRINTSTIASKGQSVYDSEVAGAKEIVQALRNKGYTIACYTYENKDYRQMNSTTITAELNSWTTQITSVIGEVDTFVFAKMGNISEYGTGSSFKVMHQSGFRYFISNADSPMTEVNPTYVRQNRLMVTGETMQHYSSRFTGLFDCAAILDVNIRGDVPKG
ncbi:MAG: hypothetical protein IKA16_03575 [Oscillospiraceae bacterium]|nr:hypothetical protein [Oscillospiraceae bacterium]